MMNRPLTFDGLFHRHLTVTLVLMPIFLLAGCGGTEEDQPGDAPPPTLTGNAQADELIGKLHKNVVQLKVREPELFDAHKQYAVERYTQLAVLRAAMRGRKESLEELRAITGRTSDETVLQIRRADKRASDLWVYIQRLDVARKRVRVLIEDHEYAINDLTTQAKITKLLDDKLLADAEETLAAAAEQDELNVDRVLKNPELFVDLAEGREATATALSDTMLPSRPEKSLDELPDLPELKFAVAGDDEKFLLADLHEILDEKKAEATTSLAKGLPEDAIARLQAGLNDIRTKIAAYQKVKSLPWSTPCLQEVQAASVALSEQLAGPYLTGIRDAIGDARRTSDWNPVLDLVEAVNALAPTANGLPETLAALETVLRYRANTNDFDAAVALERLQILRGTGSSTGSNAGDVKEITVKGIVTRWRWCPAGVFPMGSPANEAGRDSNENQVTVTLSQGFWMLETEVTQELWTAVMGTSLDWDDYGKGPKYPVYNVSHDEAVAFCAKFNALLKSVSGAEGLAVRLPSEAEWEYAARAGTTTRYYWGDRDEDADAYAWHEGNSNRGNHPVGTKQPNAWGLHDMSGSVWEWVGDWYDDELAGGTDPRGPSSASNRVYRGGSWGFGLGDGFLRSAYRSWSSPDGRNYDLGFRMACSSVKG